MSLVDPVILSGARLVEVALHHGLARPEEIIVLRGGSSRGLARLVADAESTRVPVRFVDAMDGSPDAAEVALALGARENLTLEAAVSARPKRLLVLALEGVEDPHNLGSILRAAVAFGADAAVLDRHAREMPRDVVARASAGASECLPIIFSDDLPQTLGGLYALEVECVAATVDEGASAFDMKWPARACLVIGGERRGLSRGALDSCRRRVAIPMAPTVDSLPAVVCASALLFAFARQQKA